MSVKKQLPFQSSVPTDDSNRTRPWAGGEEDGGSKQRRRRMTDDTHADSTPPLEDSEPEADCNLRLYSSSAVPGKLKSVAVTEAAVERLFKVIIIGDPTVGKTSFVQRYVQNSYRRDYKATVGVDFALKFIKWSDTHTVKLQLWDIAGQERFTWMTRVYYKDAHGCIIMFDLSNKNSFANALKWKRDVDSKCTLTDGSNIPCMLLANKSDLSHRQVDLFEVETFQKEHNFIGWTEISTKEDLMVNDSMRFLVDVMMGQAVPKSCKPGESTATIKLVCENQDKSKCRC